MRILDLGGPRRWLLSAGCVISAVLFAYSAACVFSGSLQPSVIAGALAIVVICVLAAAALYGVHVTDRAYFTALVTFLLAMGVLQICCVGRLRFDPVHDLEAVYKGAVQWMETGSFQDYYDYFYLYPNNFGALALLRMMFQAGRLFTHDYFMIAGIGVMVMLLCTFAVTSLVARELYGNKAGISVLAMFACMPVWPFLASVPYTDTMSVLFPVLALWLALRGLKSRQWTRVLLFSLSGMAVAVGGAIKATVYIMGIAIALGVLFCAGMKLRDAAMYIIAAVVACLLVSACMSQYFYSRHLDREIAAQENMPVAQWFLIGTSDGGQYMSPYPDFSYIEDRDDRSDATWAAVRRQVSDKGLKGMLELYSFKLFVLFGDGTLQVSNFLDNRPLSRSAIHDWILYDGQHYDAYSAACNTVWYGIMLLAAFGALLLAEGCVRGHGPGAAEAAMAFALCGVVLFFLHWEVSQRYITNYVPAVILLAAGGLEMICRRLNNQII
ncbi:MAG: glycosyltransferase family 39 protein [Muribaculaceae bacterium]|nr:glycosyltransferase family 39 protein [Muribaculaceae bacterium]